MRPALKKQLEVNLQMFLNNISLIVDTINMMLVDVKEPNFTPTPDTGQSKSLVLLMKTNMDTKREYKGVQI